MVYTVYPNAIDGSNQLPVTTDNVTPVKGEVVNRLRDAIIAVETELGIKPSGTYTTVRARLDAMELGGGGGDIDIWQNGSPVLPNARIINFLGSNTTITVGDPVTRRADITISNSGISSAIQETIAVTSDGQSAFLLSQVPADATTVEMFFNGEKQEYGGDYTVSGTAVTYTGIPLITTDIIEFWYLIGSGGGGGGGSGLAEVSFEVSGVYSGAAVPGLFDPPYLAASALTISSVSIIRRTAGSSGTTRCDVLIDGVSIFASSSVQPQIDYTDGDDAHQTVTAFVTSAVTANQYIDVSLEEVEGGSPEGVRVVVKFASSGSGGGGGETLAETLVLGNTTAGNDIVLSSGDSLVAIGSLQLKVGSAELIDADANRVKLMKGVVSNTTTQTGDYTALITDYIIFANPSAALAVTLPSAPENGTTLIIKDVSGNASTYNITVTRGGSDQIDGATTYTLSSDYQSITLAYRSAGTMWHII